MTATLHRPTSSGGGGDYVPPPAPGASPLRGALVVAAAVVIGFVLMANVFDNGSSGVTGNDSGQGAGASQSDPTSAGDPSAAVTHPNAEVNVLVLNASGKGKMAAKGVDALKGLGYAKAAPGNAVGQVAKTEVFYVPGYQADGEAIVAALGESEITAQPLPDPLPKELPALTEGVQVVVVVGQTSVLTAGEPASSDQPATQSEGATQSDGAPVSS